MNSSDKQRELDSNGEFEEGAAKQPGRATVSPIDEVTLVQSLAGDDTGALIEPTLVNPAHGPKKDGTPHGQFGEYEIVCEIARGGMGVVYEARHRKLNRAVALKMILRGDFASIGDIERFHLEAQAAAGLDHMGIVPIYEVGEHDGKQFFAMAFIEGGSLADLVKRGPLTNRDAADLMKKIVDAIAYAHDHGVIHRDLKPGNILIGVDGQPKITDFGLAKKVEDDSGLTQSGQILGTPSYMPPEQAAGDSANVGPSADIYALGAILYCLLTGRAPFQSAKAIDTIMLVLNEEPVRPGLLNPTIDADLETISLRCLEKSPERRFETATALSDELGRYLAGRPILSRPVSRIERVARWCYRHPWIAGLSLTTVALLILGTTVSSIFGVLANRSAQLADQKSQEAKANYENSEMQRERADANATLAKAGEVTATQLLTQVEAEKQRATDELKVSQRLLNLNHIQSAAREWKTSHAAAAWKSLDAYRGENFGWEHQYLFNLFSKNHQTLEGHRDDINAIDVSPDERLLVSASGGRWSDRRVFEVKVWDLEKQEVLFTLSDFDSPVNDVAFHPTGRTFVLATSSGEVRICSAATGEMIFSLPQEVGVHAIRFGNKGRLLAIGRTDGVTQIWNAVTRKTLEFAGDTGSVHALAFSPDEKLLITCSDKMVTIWNVANGETVHRLEGHGSTVTCVDFDSTGKRVATGGWEGRIIVWDVSNGAAQLELPGHHLAVCAIEFGSDDSQLISSSVDQTVAFWDLESQSATRSLEGHTGSVLDISLIRNGNQVVSAGGDGLIKIWDQNVNDQNITFRDHLGPVGAVAFSPDGTHAASTGGLLKLWDALTGEIQHEFADYIAASAIAFSPNGERIAAAGWGGTVIVWDVATGQATRLLPESSQAKLSISYSHSGKQIAVGVAGGSVLLLDAETGKIIHEIEQAGDIKGVAFTLDDEGVIAGSTSGSIQCWNRKTAKMMYKFSGPEEAVYTMSLSSDGALLATGGPTSNIFLRNAATGEFIDTLKSRLIQVYSISIGSNGKRLVAGGSDGSLELWDVTQRQRTIVLEGHKSPVIAASFSPDGRMIVSGSRDQTAKIWNASDTIPAKDGNAKPMSDLEESVATWKEPSVDPYPASGQSSIHALLMVENHSRSAVRLSWSDWDGERVAWPDIEPGRVYRQSTYENHVWVLTDAAGNDLGSLTIGRIPVVVIVADDGVSLRQPAIQSTRQPDRKLSYLNQRVEDDADNPYALIARAKWFGARGKWEDATADLKSARRFDPQNVEVACLLAALLVFQRENTAYEKLRSEIIQQWGDASNPRDCERLSKACLLLPENVDLEIVNRMTSRALAIGPDFPFFRYFLMLKGLNAYRNGKFDEAVTACKESRQLNDQTGNPYLELPNWLIESLSHSAAGRQHESQVALQHAEKIFETRFPPLDSGKMNDWHDWLMATVLLEEARTKQKVPGKEES